ncbi:MULTISPECIES: hypothetical protein [unclassified Nocardioides]|jgi:hypothetical protein|uniref:hypothetical protein n=1 Tax=unclassified Nocardioides TaxID=2615069 RepID=UPI0007028A4C|nr:MULTISPECIES: hypothetical protein [unclassified Nocardioides]KRC55150.1 hypothetical protein ASE19_05835 [Nocardioides sp. Root79]KRC73967.1 hypothetical protein ASE20_03380 [Nocardioides sp. Root240]
MTATIDFCGERYRLNEGALVVMGREGDIVIDDNPYLHRRFLEFSLADDLLWIANVGTAITATIADQHGLVQSWLAPGARVPLVFPQTVIWFTAGPTTYEFDVFNHEPKFVQVADVREIDGQTTLGRVSLTPDQTLLLVALAEDILRRDQRGAGAIPPSRAAAERLGWTMTRFNRKIDNVCEKFTKLGVRGLHGSADRTASNRRIRLVEYVLAARIITAEDLSMLDGLPSSS